MKKVSLSEFQNQLMRFIIMAEIVIMDNLDDNIGWKLMHTTGNYSPLVMYSFTDEEVEYIKLRMCAISDLRKQQISEASKWSIKKIERILEELKAIFN